jgi:hypothetical protein
MAELIVDPSIDLTTTNEATRHPTDSGERACFQHLADAGIRGRDAEALMHRLMVELAQPLVLPAREQALVDEAIRLHALGKTL